MAVFKLFKKQKQHLSQEEIVQQNREKTAQQWIQVADIEGAIIRRKDNLLVAILRIQPENLDLLSDREQRRKVELLAEELNGETEGLQIFCVGRPVDLDNYLEWLRDKSKMEQDFTRKMILKGYIQQAAEMASSGETTERRFYMIITKKAGHKAEVDLLNKVNDLQNKLFQAELTATVCQDNTLLDVLTLFTHPTQAGFERSEMDFMPGRSTIWDPPEVKNLPTTQAEFNEETTGLSESTSTLTKNPYLLRCSSQEKIYINRPVFKLGKELTRVDYWIENTHVSRGHAEIVVKNGDFFIRDNNSLNGTYVNGYKISSRMDVKLLDQYKITLANEDFIFRLDQGGC